MNAIAGIAVIAAAATLGDFIWYAVGVRHTMTAGILHGALLLATVGAALGAANGRLVKGLPIGAVAVLGSAVICAAPPLLFAWRVTRADHALFAHAVAILCSIGLVTTGAEIAVRRGRWRPIEPPLRRLSQATIPLTALGIVALAGVIELLSN